MITILKNNWKFIKQDIKEAKEKIYDDSKWMDVTVPHDYAILGPFDRENDKQITSVVADGILTPIVHVGRTGGLPICDKAWYRRKFNISDEGKNVFLEFDGVMCNSKIYVNGKYCGGRIYGYSSFSIDITNYVVLGENIVSVSVNPEPFSSRWYTGAGIFRQVRLIEKNNLYFPYNSTFVRASVRDNKAIIDIDTKVETNSFPYTLKYTIYDENKNVVISESKDFYTKDCYNVLEINKFKYWNIRNSYLYKLKIELYIEETYMDTYIVPFGIRTIEFNSEKGFILNGKQTKINGVCMHHDLGAIGAAFNESAARRQIEKLVEIGVNGYRFSHNPPDPKLLDLCDEYGIVVMDESFDAWQMAKVDNGYNKYFKSEAQKDMEDLIKRDRNHPCVIMWSIGNEILEQGVKDGWKTARFLNNICKKEDPTRPTTAGFNQTLKAFENGLYREVDLVGINYKPHLYEKLHKDYPNVIMYGSETGSSVSSRGEFYQPAKIEHPATPRKTLQMSDYDLASPEWAYPMEREFLVQNKLDYVFGHFVWTGFDYLGEPTPYRDNWPSRSSYFGIFDIAGMEKSRVYSFKSQWTNEEFVHIAPHWNWEQGQLVDVMVYSSFDKVELFLNGKSLGINSKIINSKKIIDNDINDEIRSNRIIWDKVPFEPGQIKAVAVDKKEVYHIVKTAGKPFKILLEPEVKQVKANGEDLAYIKCIVVDKDENICPKSNIRLEFDVTGAGEYVAADNGNAASDRKFCEKYCDTFNGCAMVIVKSIENISGDIKVSVYNENLGTFFTSICSK